MTPENLTGLNWRKSSYSSSNAQCVEVAIVGADIAVRDSKDPDGPALTLTAQEWQAFTAGMAAGQLDLG